MSKVRVNNITNASGNSGTTVAGIPEISSNSHFVVPTGRTGTRYADGGENIVRDGLVLYLDAKYSYPGASGTNPDVYTWYDMSGNENHGELKNGVGYSPMNGGSLVFDGGNDYVPVNSFSAFGDNDPITIESWVNADTILNTYQVISTAKATSTHWQLSYSGDPTYNILWAFAGTSNSVGTTTLPSVGAWHHIVTTYNGGEKTQLASWKVYVDGSPSTIQLTGSTGGVTNETTIGFRQGGSAYNYFDGKIAKVSIYNRALTAAEVLQNYNATKSRFGL